MRHAKASSGSPAPKMRLLSLATRVQSVSALSFSAFLAMHLAAPLGSALNMDASGIMLLTREYYQTPLLEPILVWGSLVAHVISGAIRRKIVGPSKKRISLQSLTGFLLVPLVLGHSITHRILPARKGISPSLLSYQFVSLSLLRYPVISWLSYAAISTAASYHALSGLRMLLSGRRKAAKLPGNNIGRVGFASIVGSLGIGLANLAGAGDEIPAWLGKRYMEVLRQVYLH